MLGQLLVYVLFIAIALMLGWIIWKAYTDAFERQAATYVEQQIGRLTARVYFVPCKEKGGKIILDRKILLQVVTQEISEDLALDAVQADQAALAVGADDISSTALAAVDTSAAGASEVSKATAVTDTAEEVKAATAAHHAACHPGWSVVNGNCDSRSNAPEAEPETPPATLSKADLEAQLAELSDEDRELIEDKLEAKPWLLEAAMSLDDKLEIAIVQATPDRPRHAVAHHITRVKAH